MTALANPFAPRAAIAPDVAARVKAWVRAALALDEEALISIREGDACLCCGPLETVVTVTQRGQPARVLRMPCDAASIREDDVARACQAAVA